MPQVTFTISANAVQLAARGLPKEEGQTDGQVLKAYVESVIKDRIRTAKREDAINATNTDVTASELS